MCCYALFNFLKCNPQSTYLIKNTSVKFSNTHRDLGIMMDENLSWSSHYNLISSKAYRSLHFIRRTIPITTSIHIKKQLYISLVRNHLTYCFQLWRPRLIKDIKALERIQRRATMFIFNNCSATVSRDLFALTCFHLCIGWNSKISLFL